MIRALSLHFELSKRSPFLDNTKNDLHFFIIYHTIGYRIHAQATALDALFSTAPERKMCAHLGAHTVRKIHFPYSFLHTERVRVVAHLQRATILLCSDSYLICTLCSFTPFYLWHCVPLPLGSLAPEHVRRVLFPPFLSPVRVNMSLKSI